MSKSKSAAIREARNLVSRLHRYGPTDYVVYGPARASEPYGPTTTAQRDSHSDAMCVRTAWIAEVALSLMGKLDAWSRDCLDENHPDYRFGGYTVENVVNAGLKAYKGRTGTAGGIIAEVDE